MSAPEPATKRRKVRKGTQSCWECRRRKVRCIFAATTTSVCNNCTRRKTPCVSQELLETSYLDFPPGDEQLGVRLGRVEELLGRLSNPHVSDRLGLNDPNTQSLEDHPNGTASASPAEVTLGSQAAQSPWFERRDYSRPTVDEFKESNERMVAAWPSRAELSLICALPVGLSSHLHCGFCRPDSNTIEKGTGRKTDLLHLPSVDAHPVLLARKLLILGTFIQGALPSAVKAMEDKGFFPLQIMHRVVDTATKLVTTRDELLCSIEAVECIMLEAMYHNYSGNLHRSWMATRRAITTAQAMALHRGITTPSVRFLEPNSRRDFDLDQLTFRLAEMDAYLSIMLGLQRSSLDTNHITHERALAACCPAERMRRIHYIVQERIIRHSTSSALDLAEVHEMDRTLQKAAAEMSPRWWLTPTFTPDDADETKVMQDMIRTMGQLSHYHVLIRLHLPYVLSSDRRCDYSKLVAVNTSRELLIRFLSFRTSNPAHYYCRGSDCLAFIASTILCVVHIKSSKNANNNPLGHVSDNTGFEFLAHNRLSDRGLMEQALDIVESMYEPGVDAISTRISRILRDLLFIESSASAGKAYDVSSSEATSEELECDGKMLGGGKTMRVHIPNFGNIDFVRNIVSRTAHVPRGNPVNAAFPPATVARDSNLSPALTASDATLDDNAIPFAQDFTTCSLTEPSQQAFTGVDRGCLEQPNLGFPWIEEDNWDLQGVDFALFDTLFSGSVSEDQTDIFQ
ncbi:hypothetical protein DPSP01_010749 [Paraphaeosphaeria sporulosa]